MEYKKYFQNWFKISADSALVVWISCIIYNVRLFYRWLIKKLHPNKLYRVKIERLTRTMTHNLYYGVSEKVSFTFLICVGRRGKGGILKLSTNLEKPWPVYTYIFDKLVLFLDFLPGRRLSRKQPTTPAIRILVLKITVNTLSRTSTPVFM